MIVTTLALPPALHKRIAVAAIEEHAAVAQLIRDAVTEWLDRRSKRRGGRQ